MVNTLIVEGIPYQFKSKSDMLDFMVDRNIEFKAKNDELKRYLGVKSSNVADNKIKPEKDTKPNHLLNCKRGSGYRVLKLRQENRHKHLRV